MPFDDTTQAGTGLRITKWGDTSPAKPKIDLDAFTTEAMLDRMSDRSSDLDTKRAIREEARRRGVPLKHFNPDWKPTDKPKIDKDSDAHQAAALIAVRGIPLIPTITWAECQLFDNGPSDGKHAHTRYVAKITCTSAAPGSLIANGKRSLCRDWYSFFSTPKQFMRNLKRKKPRHALTEAEMETAVIMAAKMTELDGFCGTVSSKLHGEGTIRAVRQFIALWWCEEDGEQKPRLFIIQETREGEFHNKIVELGNPPEKEGRSAKACRWYARWESEAFSNLMAAATGDNSAVAAKLAAMKGGRA
jgi:hypothetical protein